MRVRMNGTEGFPSLCSAERGCSTFADFPRTSEAIESLRLQEHAAEVSQANHSFEEALKLAASDGHTPPETYMEMRPSGEDNATTSKRCLPSTTPYSSRK